MTMREERERVRHGPMQPDGRLTSGGDREWQGQVRQSAAAVGRSRQERGLTRANGMSPYITPPSRTDTPAVQTSSKSNS